jgi:DNA-binding response OmpR family regulator
MRVLVAEDDPRLACELVRGLRANGFEPSLVSSCAALLAEVARDVPRVITLDLGLSDGDAITLLPRLRALPGVRVIVLTARSELASRLDAFALGAADYVCKPFFMAELVARIHARTGEPAATRRVDLAGVEVDIGEGTAIRDGAAVELTPTERALLAYLVSRPGRAVSRAALVEHVLPTGGAERERAVDVHVSRLRAKLGPAAAKLLQTVWGVGWRFAP